MTPPPQGSGGVGGSGVTDPNQKCGEFHIVEDLCTGCGDCIKAMPKHFRDTGEDTAEVITCEGADPGKVEEVMKACPGKAIKWKG